MRQGGRRCKAPCPTGRAARARAPAPTAHLGAVREKVLPEPRAGTHGGALVHLAAEPNLEELLHAGTPCVQAYVKFKFREMDPAGELHISLGEES